MILRGLGHASGQPRIPDGLVVLRTGPEAPEPIVDILSSLGLSGAFDPSTTTRRALDVIVEDARGRWEERLPDPTASKLQVRLGLASTDLGFLWAGLGAREPVAALHRCVELGARWSGIEHGDRAGSYLAASARELASLPTIEHAPARRREMDELAGRVRELEAVPEELLLLESELRDLRADTVEATGDAEAQTVEWLRERQVAESELFAYRDRARELKIRLHQMEATGKEGDCPTCGRPLAEHFEPVLVTFSEEWESVVQDGSWWKRRREQLEEKPDSVKALEGRILRLHAAIETAAEKLERGRGALEELGVAQKRLEDMRRRLGRGAGDAGSGDADAEPDLAGSPPTLPDARDQRRAELTERSLRLASRWVNDISGGRYGGLDHRDGRVVLIRDGSSVPVSTGADQAMVSIALRVAAVRFALDADVPLGSVAFSDLEALGAEGRTRALTAFRKLLPDVRQVVVSSRVGPGIDRGPYDAAFAFTHSREEGARLEPVHEGPGAVQLSGMSA